MMEVCFGECSQTRIPAYFENAASAMQATAERRSQRSRSLMRPDAAPPKLVDYTKCRGPNMPLFQVSLSNSAGGEKSDKVMMLPTLCTQMLHEPKVDGSVLTSCAKHEASQRNSQIRLPRRVQSLEVFPTHSHRRRPQANEERVEFMFRIQPRHRNRSLSSADRIRELAEALASKEDSPGKSPLVSPRKILRPSLFREADRKQSNSSGASSPAPRKRTARTGLHRCASESVLSKVM